MRQDVTEEREKTEVIIYAYMLSDFSFPQEKNYSLINYWPKYNSELWIISSIYR